MSFRIRKTRNKYRIAERIEAKSYLFRFYSKSPSTLIGKDAFIFKSTFSEYFHKIECIIKFAQIFSMKIAFADNTPISEIMAFLDSIPKLRYIQSLKIKSAFDKYPDKVGHLVNYDEGVFLNPTRYKLPYVAKQILSFERKTMEEMASKRFATQYFEYEYFFMSEEKSIRVNAARNLNAPNLKAYRLLFADLDKEVIAEVAKNPNAVLFPEYRNLMKDHTLMHAIESNPNSKIHINPNTIIRKGLYSLERYFNN